jgi:hypothetical protein
VTTSRLRFYFFAVFFTAAQRFLWAAAIRSLAALLIFRLGLTYGVTAMPASSARAFMRVAISESIEEIRLFTLMLESIA